MTKLEFTNCEVYARHQLQVGWTKIHAKEALVVLLETPYKPVVQVFYKAGRMRKFHAITWGSQVVIANGSEQMTLPNPLEPVAPKSEWLQSRFSPASNEWLYELVVHLTAYEAEILWQGECNDSLGHCQLKLQGEKS